MEYNLNPILKYLDKSSSYAQTWKENFEIFFSHQSFDPVIQDFYYNAIIHNLEDVKKLLAGSYLIDDYSGLFTFDVLPSEMDSFSLALFIEKNFIKIKDKKIMSISFDYGISSVQTKLCGLNLVNAIVPSSMIVASVLTCIGNKAPPYLINSEDEQDFDTLIVSNAFGTEDLAYAYWNFMLDQFASKKEVLFKTNTFAHLKKYINFDKIEVVMDSKTVYDADHLSNLKIDYRNKIYRII
jgi:hypothetical protein